MNVEILEGGEVEAAELVALYDSVGWRAYTADPAGLVAAVRASAWVACAREEGRLVGFARALSDDVAIAFLQDLLVRPDRQRTGTGRALVERFHARFAHVRTCALLTDDEPRQAAFYRSVGFEPLEEAAGGRIRAFLRLRRA